MIIKVSGISEMNSKFSTLQARLAEIPAERRIRLYIMLQNAAEYIQLRLRGLYPSEHFGAEVDVQTNGVFELRVTADEIGSYIYHGTAPHHISAHNSAMPIGDNRFAMSVSHPGTAPQNEAIDQIVYQAFAMMWAGDALWGS